MFRSQAPLASTARLAALKREECEEFDAPGEALGESPGERELVRVRQNKTASLFPFVVDLELGVGEERRHLLRLVQDHAVRLSPPPERGE